MPKSYSFPFDVWKSTMKTQDTLPSTRVHSFLSAQTMPPQSGPRNQLGLSYPIFWRARVTGGLGAQQVCPDMLTLLKNSYWSTFLWEKLKEYMMVRSFSCSAAVTRVFWGAVSGTRTTTLTRATATTAFPGTVAEDFGFSQSVIVCCYSHLHSSLYFLDFCAHKRMSGKKRDNLTVARVSENQTPLSVSL